MALRVLALIAAALLPGNVVGKQATVSTDEPKPQQQPVLLRKEDLDADPTRFQRRTIPAMPLSMSGNDADMIEMLKANGQPAAPDAQPSKPSGTAAGLVELDKPASDQHKRDFKTPEEKAAFEKNLAKIRKTGVKTAL
eukprot:TRINITY_DN658_c2_g1_i1.p2 TRINITY_DN658_c2_g1~~TRINITY_DN658_c2_g1_i1.p2  ORF type:complete len:138 (-),score=38.43 TRINITY_DN658_c2_g1_i1:108-521(-)